MLGVHSLVMYLKTEGEETSLKSLTWEENEQVKEKPSIDSTMRKWITSLKENVSGATRASIGVAANHFLRFCVFIPIKVKV